MSEIKIIFENPETRNRDFIILKNEDIKTDDGFFKNEFLDFKNTIYDPAKYSDMIELPKIGELQKSAIKGFIKLKKYQEKTRDFEFPYRDRRKIKSSQKLRIETYCADRFSMPKDEGYKKIMLRLFVGTVWNWRSDQEVSEILQKGDDFLKSDLKKDYQ